MKKLLMFALLAATTMSFATYNVSINPIEVGSACEYHAKVYLENKLSTNHYGGQLYAYFTSNDGSDPTKDLTVYTKYPWTLEHVRNNVYRVKINMDYKFVLGPQNGETLDLFTVKPSSSSRCYQPYTRYNKHYEMVLQKGETYYSNQKHPTFNARVGALVDKDYTCPGFNGRANFIRINAENDDPATKIVSGNPKGVTINSSKDPTFYYCPIVASSMPARSYDYAVLKLDDECPSGSYEVKRHHDTQDKKNNAVQGYFYPNVLGDNADLYYCFVPKYTGTVTALNSKSLVSMPFGDTFGVFGNPSTTISGIAHSELYVDDEDDDNANSWDLSKVPSQYQSAVKRIMSGSKNTTYHIINKSSTSLSKASAVEESAELSAPIVANTTLAAIKGVSREAVAVELQTAGNTEVSLVSVNGHVFAKVSAQDLEAGVHSLNWNAASVPAGRYIVTVKHNGSVSGKNVLLK